jgi:hypothetical protein
MRVAFAVLMVFLFRAGPAAADLYRWVDPETGSVKFSSYPPPWYDDPAQARRAPKVEHIPAGRDAAAKPDAAGRQQEDARRMEVLEAQRKAMLLQISRLAPQSGTERGAQALQKQLEGYAAVSNQMDKLDPEGAAARRGDMQMLVDKLMRGESR